MRPLAPVLVALARAASGVLLLHAAACADDRAEPTSTQFGPPITSATVTGLSPTTTDDLSSTDDASPTASTTTEEDASTTRADSTGTTGTTGTTECAPADDADEDGDAIPNKEDNCRCVANPMQLDFDGDKLGNVCDAPLVFTVVDGLPPDFNELDTIARFEHEGGFCNVPISFVAQEAEAQVQLDDKGTGTVWLKRIDFALTPEWICDLKLAGLAPLVIFKFYLKHLYSEGPGTSAVEFPFFPAEHATGVATGIMTAPHAMRLTGTLVISESTLPEFVPPEDQVLDNLEGLYPAGAVSVLDHGQVLELKFGNNKGLVFDQTTMSGYKFTLSGLKGKLRLVQ